MQMNITVRGLAIDSASTLNWWPGHTAPTLYGHGSPLDTKHPGHSNELHEAEHQEGKGARVLVKHLEQVHSVPQHEGDASQKHGHTEDTCVGIIMGVV